MPIIFVRVNDDGTRDIVFRAADHETVILTKLVA